MSTLLSASLLARLVRARLGAHHASTHNVSLLLFALDLEWDERVSAHIMKNLRPLHDPLDEENVRVTQPMSMTSFLRQRVRDHDVDVLAVRREKWLHVSWV